jgi:hypothetical protein
MLLVTSALRGLRIIFHANENAALHNPFMGLQDFAFACPPKGTANEMPLHNPLMGLRDFAFACPPNEGEPKRNARGSERRARQPRRAVEAGGVFFRWVGKRVKKEVYWEPLLGLCSKTRSLGLLWLLDGH